MIRIEVVEAYRLDRYDNFTIIIIALRALIVVEAYRLDRYDNFIFSPIRWPSLVVEAYRLDRYDNFSLISLTGLLLTSVLRHPDCTCA